MATPKNTICLWYDGDAEAAARFYAATFPDSAVTAVHRAPADFPGGHEGDVLTVTFTVCGIPCLGLNGGPTFPQTEALILSMFSSIFSRTHSASMYCVLTCTNGNILTLARQVCKRIQPWDSFFPFCSVSFFV